MQEEREKEDEKEEEMLMRRQRNASELRLAINEVTQTVLAGRREALMKGEKRNREDTLKRENRGNKEQLRVLEILLISMKTRITRDKVVKKRRESETMFIDDRKAARTRGEEKTEREKGESKRESKRERGDTKNKSKRKL